MTAMESDKIMLRLTPELRHTFFSRNGGASLQSSACSATCNIQAGAGCGFLLQTQRPAEETQKPGCRDSVRWGAPWHSQIGKVGTGFEGKKVSGTEKVEVLPNYLIAPSSPEFIALNRNFSPSIRSL